MVIKRKANELERYLSEWTSRKLFGRWAWRGRLAKIGYRILQGLYLFLLFVLSAGIINSILEGSTIQAPPTSIIPSRAAQTYGETVIVFFVILIGTVGMYAMHMSTKQTFRRRMAGFYMLGGFVALIVGIAVGLYLLALKGF